MKTAIFILMGFVGIICILLIIALLIKKEYGVIREIIINKPKKTVFEYVKLLRNQDNFSVWANKDPEMVKEYQGIDGKVGFVSAWDSKMKDVGKGEQEIEKIIDGERIDYELRFLKPFASISSAWFTFEVVSETQTKVKWGFSGKMKYPMNLFLLTMNMEGMIGKDFQNGLNNLKGILEK